MMFKSHGSHSNNPLLAGSQVDLKQAAMLAVKQTRGELTSTLQHPDAASAAPACALATVLQGCMPSNMLRMHSLIKWGVHIAVCSHLAALVPLVPTRRGLGLLCAG
eukprot:1161078-Pelagomonas_calceolata.AAC.1